MLQKRKQKASMGNKEVMEAKMKANGLAGRNRMCGSRDLGLDLDDWCQMSCNLADPNCPHHMCACDKAIECVSLRPHIKSSWCTENCNAAFATCPRNLCKCEGVSPPFFVDFTHAEANEMKDFDERAFAQGSASAASDAEAKKLSEADAMWQAANAAKQKDGPVKRDSSGAIVRLGEPGDDPEELAELAEPDEVKGLLPLPGGAELPLPSSSVPVGTATANDPQSGQQSLPLAPARTPEEEHALDELARRQETGTEENIVVSAHYGATTNGTNTTKITAPTDADAAIAAETTHTTITSDGNIENQREKRHQRWVEERVNATNTNTTDANATDTNTTHANTMHTNTDSFIPDSFIPNASLVIPNASVTNEGCNCSWAQKWANSCNGGGDGSHCWGVCCGAPATANVQQQAANTTVAVQADKWTGSKPQVDAQAQAWSQAEAKATAIAKAKKAATARAEARAQKAQAAEERKVASKSAKHIASPQQQEERMIIEQQQGAAAVGLQPQPWDATPEQQAQMRTSDAEATAEMTAWAAAEAEAHAAVDAQVQAEAEATTAQDQFINDQWNQPVPVQPVQPVPVAVAQPVQPVVAQPVQPAVGQPVQPVQPVVVQPVQPAVVQPVQPVVVQPVQPVLPVQLVPPVPPVVLQPVKPVLKPTMEGAGGYLTRGGSEQASWPAPQQAQQQSAQPALTVNPYPEQQPVVVQPMQPEEPEEEPPLARDVGWPVGQQEQRPGDGKAKEDDGVLQRMLHPEEYRPPQQEQAEVQVEAQLQMRDRLQRAQQRQHKRAERQPQPPQAPLTSGCHDMATITADQLKCVYPSLDHDRAFEYATAASAKLGSLLGTTCAWAAFLGNAAVVSKELTTWKEAGCLTEAPYCGRGPLQLTSYSSYDFCSAQPSCNCPNIADDIESVSKSSQIGFGSAACVWGDLFGTSLSSFADGTREGFLQTACALHQGKYPCDAVFPEGKPYEKREGYWRNASECLGVRPGRANEFLQKSSHNGRAKPGRKKVPAKSAEGSSEPKHRADALAKVAALAATLELEEAAAADQRRPLDFPGIPRGGKKRKQKGAELSKQHEAEMARRDAPAGAKLGKAAAKLTKAAPVPSKAAFAPAKLNSFIAVPAKPVKVAAKPLKPARAIAAVLAESATPPAETSVYAIEPDDPQLMAKLKASLREKEMHTEQFAMVQKALKELAAVQQDREDATSLASLQP